MPSFIKSPAGIFVFGDNCLSGIVPTKVDIDSEVISIHSGGDHTFYITLDSIYACGSNNYGQLGFGDTIRRPILTKLNYDYEIISIYCGDMHTIFHITEGIFVCGSNKYGQLGLDLEYVIIPTKLPFDHIIQFLILILGFMLLVPIVMDSWDLMMFGV